MKKLATVLCILGLSVVGCDNKATTTTPPPAGTATDHGAAGMHAAHDASAEGDKKADAAAPTATEEPKKDDAAPAATEEPKADAAAAEEKKE